DIPEPPALLYAWGDVGLLARPAAGVVGSRNHTAYGGAAAQFLAAGVARAGVVVVSGMARGIDATAHAAALDSGGASVGVLGNGFGVVYPAANRSLYERMIACGCLVTELPPGERPHAHTFPRRNRLISGLAGVTVVVEAAAGSGALITADCALDQGRTVLAVPGPITSPTSLGCNKLIQQGAKPALCPGDILEELGLPGTADPGPMARGQTPEGTSESAGAPPRGQPPDLTELQRSLWDALASEPKHVDALVAAAGAETSAVLTALTELEMRGLVKPEPGETEAHGLETLYLGGGTPSLLPPDALATLVTSLRDAFGATSSRDAIEVTVEANPEDVEPEHARAWRRAGVNRVSLGAQSFDDHVLAWMHRSHDAARIGAAVRTLRDAGVDNLSLDLIFALPAELQRDWERDLELALSLGPDHLSLYGLTVDERTPLARWISRGAVVAPED